jgi:hypothetical protein
MGERNWKEYVRLAKHYKAIGQTEIWLNRDKDAPWHLAQSVEAGSVYRLSTPVSFDFKGRDEKSGLTFRWSFDIEESNANGRSLFQVNVDAARRVKDLLPATVANRFANQLEVTAKAIREKGKEYTEHAHAQFAMADALDNI